jgi:hypothetical protein
MTGELPNKFSLMADYDIGILMQNVGCSTGCERLRAELEQEAEKRGLIDRANFTR